MIFLPGYQLSARIHQSSNSLVYRGYRHGDRLPVILKILRHDYPTPNRLTRYKQEYQITHSLELAGVVKAYSLENYQNTLVIVFEDFGGESLKILTAKKSFSLQEFLQMAISITAALNKIHLASIIHRDINPSNIVYNPQTQQVKIIDFGISTRLSSENLPLKNPALLEGTLAYISPEQTGRMNRAIDYRCDFYSLGVTFYELLTGKLPFETDDYLELIHSHLAKLAISPKKVFEERNRIFPQVISDIVMKLMSKNAEDRYQSAYGIRADLVECLQQLETTGKIKSFPLATQDIAERLQVSQQLYGREEEINSLLAAFERISEEAQQTESELFLVSGYSGVGKSALVKEIYRSIAAKKGWFISGKFDQYQRYIPYYAVIQAVKQLIEHLLTESESQLKSWRDRLQAALGVNGRVIIDLIPEVELIIGKQPAIPQLQPKEAQNRLNLVWQNFVRVFARLEHPLVLFLDDLQWADSASLELIQLLVNAPDINSLLLIGAYRDNEVDAAHPLMLSITELKKNVAVSEVNLKPLSISNINQLLADTLRVCESVALPLAELLQTKTYGNPFFLKEFIKALFEDNLLRFDLTSRSWQWDLKQIIKRQITNNVVELMSNKIRNNLDRTQEVLKLGSCIGNRFDLQTLTIIAKTSPQEIARSLDNAIVQGLILPLSNIHKSIELDVVNFESSLLMQVEYKFVHDRIQQAAYSLLSETDRLALHLKIGRALLKNTTREEQSLKIFTIVNHLNNARQLITSSIELDELFQLNQQAGDKAKASGAYQSAYNYYQLSIDLLPNKSWRDRYEITLEIYQKAAEAAYLNSDCTRTKALTEVILQQTNTVLDKIIAYEIRIKACFAKSELAYGLQFSLEALELLGFKLSGSPHKIQVLSNLLTTKLRLREKSVLDFANLQEMKNSKAVAAMRIIQYASLAAFMTNPNLYILMSLKRINLSITFGNTYESAIAYITYAWILTTVSKDITTGCQFSELALEVMSHFESPRLKPCIYFLVNTFIRPYKKHLRTTLNNYLVAYRYGLEVGDWMHTSSSIAYYIIYSYYSGVKISEIENEAANFFNTLLKIKQQDFTDLTRIYRQSLINLTISSQKPHLLKGELYNEVEMLSLHQQSDNQYLLFNLYLQKAILSYLFEFYSEALINIELATQNFNPMMGQTFAAVLNLYDSLICLNTYNSVECRSPRKIIERVKLNQKAMQTWANHAPMNYLHKYYLVEAEKYRLTGKDSLAIDFYDRAIDLAKKNEYLNEEALAHELAGKLYLEKGNRLVATAYLKQARFCYLRWGATAKVKCLDEYYPELLATAVPESNHKITVTTSSTNQKSLDLNTLIETSQALTQITDLDRLLETIVKFVLKNAGAEKGYLILVNDRDLIIQASGTTEKITTLQAIPLSQSENISQTIINYVYRTKEYLILNNASDRGLFTNDEYISSNKIKSVLCLPILNQGKSIAILYLENNLAENAFTPERLEILKLISSQAAISIENLLLRQDNKHFEYQVGGCLTLDAPTYVVRQADIDLYQNLQSGHYCYILNSRHMGKSSLRVRTMDRLQTEGTICLAIDLTSIGSKNITVEQWYAGLIYSLLNSLKLENKFNFRDWWRSLDFLSPVQKFSEFIQQVLLPQVEGKIIIFIDEIDSTLGLSFCMDDFFAVIRNCYNSRADNSNYRRLSFVLLGVATPSTLIQDKNCTPFNIGRAISLQGFQLHEIEPLVKGLVAQQTNAHILVKEVLIWTGGQPFLTQKICNLIADTNQAIPQGTEAAWIKNLVSNKIINNWKSQDDPQHLKTIDDRLLSNDSSLMLLRLYREILQQGTVVADDSNQQKELLLSGLVKQEKGRLKIYNPIYQSVFNLKWCDRLICHLTRSLAQKL